MIPEKILVVDDEEIVLDLLGKVLAKKGYAVETANDGEQALEKVKKEAFNLLIADLKMPRLSGLDLLKELKKTNPYIEVIVITGYPTVEAAVEAIKIGAFDFICKPFDVDAMLATVEHCLERQLFNISHFQLGEMMSLFEVTRKMAATVTLDDILKSVLESALQITKAKRGSLLLVDGKTGELVIKTARGLSEDVIHTTRVRVGEGIAGKVVEDGVLMRVNDIENDERFHRANSRQYETKSFVAVPLVSVPIDNRKNVLGVINVSDKLSRDAFTEREEKLLSMLADEAAIAIENFRLYSELRQKIKDLRQAIEKLNRTQLRLVQSEKLAALGRFSSGVAHEVKNPLGIILSGAEYLEMRFPNADHETKDVLQKIKESTLRADTIVQNLLKFARPSELKTEKTRPGELIEDALALLKVRALSGNIAITTDFADHDLFIDVDKNQILQTLFNILVNAVEAMPGGGKLEVKAFRSYEDLPDAGEACVIEVKDNGEGISKDNTMKLFEPFFTTKRDSGGTGLGLSMSKSIVEEHDGRLVIDSEPGKGTDVRIILPSVRK